MAPDDLITVKYECHGSKALNDINIFPMSCHCRNCIYSSFDKTLSRDEFEGNGSEIRKCPVTKETVLYKAVLT